jgi:hypothetical protein
MNHSLHKIITLLSLTVLILMIIIGGNVSNVIASNPQGVLRSELVSLEGRIRALEMEVRYLRNKIPQSSVNINPNPSPNVSPRNPQVVDGELIGRSDPLMERFATLIIELKEQVRELEKRVTQLENKP